MASDSDRIVGEMNEEFQQLLDLVSGPQARDLTAHEVECSLWWRLLALGAKLLQLFFVVRASERPDEPASSDGTRLSYHGMRQRTFFSVFGKIRFDRHYFYASGQGGECPLDAQLALPQRRYSDLLRDWAEYGITHDAYDETIGMLERILNLSFPKLALETVVGEDAVDVDAFYDQKCIPPVEAEGEILVVQSDGKGVPMVRSEPTLKKARRKKGDQRTKKKEAVLTAIYSIDPYHRTPEETAAALMRDEPEGPRPIRPEPVGKEVRATMDGKDVAFKHLTQRVAERDGNHFTARVALTDGAVPLQERMRDLLPDFTLVLDIIHVKDYLWDAANAPVGRRPIPSAPTGSAASWSASSPASWMRRSESWNCWPPTSRCPRHGASWSTGRSPTTGATPPSCATITTSPTAGPSLPA